MPGKDYACNFANVEQANLWLINQNNIIVKNIAVNTKGIGLKILNVRIDFTVSASPLNYKFQISEIKKTRVFFGSNVNKFAHKWQENNPQFKLVTNIKSKLGFSLIGGSVGFFRLIKEKHFVLYTF